MEVGEKYYIVAHAYYHYVGEVVKVIGPKTVELKNVCQIHSCKTKLDRVFRRRIRVGHAVRCFAGWLYCHGVNRFSSVVPQHSDEEEIA